MSDYPEHDKMAAIKDKAQVIGEFIEFLDVTDYTLAYDDGSRLGYVDSGAVNRLLAQFFQIDLDLIETEKHRMLAKLRAANSV